MLDVQLYHEILNQLLLALQKLKLYARVVQDKDTLLHNCEGFKNSAVLCVLRPGINQRVFYDGHCCAVFCYKRLIL